MKPANDKIERASFRAMDLALTGAMQTLRKTRRITKSTRCIQPVATFNSKLKLIELGLAQGESLLKTLRCMRSTRRRLKIEQSELQHVLLSLTEMTMDLLIIVKNLK